MRLLAPEIATAQKIFKMGFALLKVSDHRPLGKGQARRSSGPTGHTSNRKGIRLQADPDSYSPFLTSLER
jgi:hypothetical protein